MSVAFADYDHDGRLDVFVTNDTVPNFLFRNNGDGTFAETALLAGVSVPDVGPAGLGHGHRLPGLRQRRLGGHPSHRALGRNVPALPQRRPRRLRRDDAVERPGGADGEVVGLVLGPRRLDNDGWKDIFTANSHANDRIGESEAVGWKQANSLFVNDGQGRFRDATAESGLAGAVAVHRGCGVADFDGDGRLDLVVLVLGARAELWQNESAPGNRWLIVRLVGTKSNRDGIGARVIVGNQVRTMTTALGYASSSHAGVHFGLGHGAETVRVEIQWPSGTRQIVENVKTNQVRRDQRE